MFVIVNGHMYRAWQEPQARRDVIHGSSSSGNVEAPAPKEQGDPKCKVTSILPHMAPLTHPPGPLLVQSGTALLKVTSPFIVHRFQFSVENSFRKKI
ncbi:hypothetical protein GDO78_017531 [Eleutherodactylus coqui]|uniref:Uncharacterized protein n=1 Tax=Eleutherodactylus coqui TaxID=57060 RepID=A0A8J6BMR7_ELECQ|nr:hypothetical protein GDO78_017531 [Eleutherodactylus coqui]